MTHNTVQPDPEQYLHTEIRNGTGILTLDRPKALNALTAQMYRDLLETLWDWEGDPQVKQVIIQASEPRAFCAGGDIRQIRQAVVDGDIERGVAAFTDEYTLNNLIANYPKPYIALMEGYTMGGGMGLSVHGSHRIVTENTVMAMPECAIGFFPDVGASWFLPRVSLGGRPSLAVGRWMALGGHRISGAGAVAVGMADVMVPSARLETFRETAIADGVEAAMTQHASTEDDALPAATLPDQWERIEEVYGRDSLAEVIAAVGEEEFKGASPSSLVRSWELLNAGAAAESVTECVGRELALARDTISAPDFSEGVRCTLIDREDDPQWQPATVDEVDVEAIRAVLATSLPLRQRS